MHRGSWIALATAGLAVLAGLVAPLARRAEAQKGRIEPTWEYKVAPFSYNPGERMSDLQRAAFYERTLNEQAREGWEAVGTVLSRDVIQTVGGGVTTRDTTSFVAYRRARR